MSLLSENTQPEALRVLLRTLPFFRQLEKMRISTTDAFAARQAENLLRGIIESNTETTEEH